MKIAMIGQKGVPARFGGVERHVEELSARLASRGCEVFVYSRKWYSPEPGLCRGAKIAHTPCVATKHLDAITHTFTSTMHAVFSDVDIFHYHGVGPALLSWLPRILCPRARVVVTFHCIDRKLAKWGVFASLLLRLGEWAACRFAHETITVSRTLEEYCREVYGRKTIFIPNGVTVPEGGKTEQGLALISRFGLEPGAYALFVGRLVPEKGVHVLIEAWQFLRAASPEFAGGNKLVIVGGGSFTDSYVRDITKLAHDDSSIVLTGFQSGAMLDALYANSAFAIQPSFSEGMPIAVLEAMSHGKVVLASDVPGTLEAMGPHGVPFRVGDARDLAVKLAALFEAREELPKLGELAREYVREEHSWDDIAQKIHALYVRMNGGKSEVLDVEVRRAH